MTVSHSVRHNIESIKSGHYKSFQNHQNIARTVMLKMLNSITQTVFGRNDLKWSKWAEDFETINLFCKWFLPGDVG